jgi:acyl-CoA reductase-like NAD-dependent aldehyde dehydrogenase
MTTARSSPSLPTIQGATTNSSGFSTVNPANGEEIEVFSFFTPADVENTLGLADKTFRSFRKVSVHQRANLLSNLATALRRNAKPVAKVITTEMGKVLSEAEAEVEKCAHEAEWYAEHGPQILADAPAPQWHHGIGSSGPRWRSEEQRLRQRAFSLRSTCIRKRPNCMD